MKRSAFLFLSFIAIALGVFAFGFSGVIVANKPAETSLSLAISTLIVGAVGYILSRNLMEEKRLAGKFLMGMFEYVEHASIIAIFCSVACGLFMVFS